MNQMTPRLTLPKEPREFGFYVDGGWIAAGEREIFERASPAHGVPVTKVPRCTAADLDHAVAVAREAFDDRRWSGLDGASRAAVLLKAAERIRERAEEIAYWETLENGKPISQARGEVAGCVGMFEYASGIARSLHGDSFNNLGDGMFGMVTREPIGVVGVITPWNFPFLILCERVPYILAAGCTIVSKPSEMTSATSLILAECLTEAGLPAGVMNVVPGTGDEVGQAMLEHSDIDMVSFTGSTRVGRHCVQAAASNFKKLGLELGGKNPQIVFADAELEDAADGVAFGIAFNTGQCCVSGSRLIVERSVADEFTELLKVKLAKVVIGDPLDEATQVGAITTDAQNATILSYIEKGRQEGARLVCGGEPIELDGGRYIAPTIFADVSASMAIAREEIFGPVLTVTPFDTLDEAIAIANDTDYGLAASVWSKKHRQGVDGHAACSGRPILGKHDSGRRAGMPIGGFKQSGWGREAGVHGVEEYTQMKSVHVEIGRRDHWIK